LIAFLLARNWSIQLLKKITGKPGVSKRVANNTSLFEGEKKPAEAGCEFGD